MFKNSGDYSFSRQFGKIASFLFKKMLIFIFKFILFCIFVWQIRNCFRFKVICCFWSVAIKIILNSYIKCYCIKSVLLRNIRVLVCGRRLKRKRFHFIEIFLEWMPLYVCLELLC